MAHAEHNNDYERQSAAERAMLKKHQWTKVHAPRTWRPVTAGELVGFYGGRTTRQGQWGQYDVVIVHVPRDGSYTISGVGILQLFDAAMIKVGHPVRVVYHGRELVGRQAREFKRFELFVAEGEPISEELLPHVE